MISAIVLAPDVADGEDVVRLSEVVVRSLAWLVSAVVAGVVRDVTLAAPPGLGLGDIADQAGCGLVQAETEAERLSSAVDSVRGPLLLVVKAGFQPQSGLIDEIDDLIRHEPRLSALILSAPAGLVERIFPDRADPVGLLAPVDLCRDKGHIGFHRLVRSLKGASPLRHRASDIS